MQLYVYYRIAPAQADPAQAAFRQACATAPVALLQRPELRDGLLTWMEVYPEACTGLEPAVAAAMQPWVQGERHREAFYPLV
jgi:hypothetical protein